MADRGVQILLFAGAGNAAGGRGLRAPPEPASHLLRTVAASRPFPRERPAHLRGPFQRGGIGDSRRYDPAEQVRDLERRLRALLAIGHAEMESRRQKAAAAASLPFPHAAPRPGQKIMMEAVRRALEKGENLIAEAATAPAKPPRACIRPWRTDWPPGGRCSS